MATDDVSYYIAQGDLEPDMPIDLTVNGSASAITGATGAVMLWKKPDGTFEEVALTIIDADAGQVARVWAAGDTAVIGKHKGQVVVTHSNGEEQSFPSDGTYFEWRVTKRLAA